MTSQRERILGAARDLYLEQGLKGLSMRKVASRIGVTATAIYRHFRNKEELIYHVIGEGFRLFGSYLYRALKGNTPRERFQRCGEAYLQFGLEKSKYYEVIFMSPDLLGYLKIPPEIQRQAGATFQFLVNGVREGIEAGFLKKAEPEAIALTIWAQCHGLLSLYLSRKLEQDPKRFRKLYWASLERLFAGLMK